MITLAPYLLTSIRLDRYQRTMFQATLQSKKSSPLAEYSVHKLYLKQQDWSIQTSIALSTALEKAQEFQETAKKFDTASKNNLINSRSVFSTDLDAVTTKAKGKAAMTSYQVGVTKLATAQINKGSSLYGNARSSISSGYHTFAITVGDKQHDVSFFSYASDTNKDSLSRMASAINEKKIGLYTYVTSDEQTGTSQLVVTGELTGEDNAFSIKEMEGNSVSASGIDQIAQEAQDATYQVNDKSFTSASNTVTLGEHKDLSVTFHKTTTEDVELTVKANSDEIVREVEDLLTDYNEFLSYLSENRGTYSFDMYTRWKNVINRVRGLDEMGIQRNFDGTLSLNEDVLSDAIDKDFPSVEKLLSSTNGLATSLGREADRLQDMPVGFLSPFAHNTNPYSSYLLPNMFYRQASMTGLFFNQIA